MPPPSRPNDPLPTPPPGTGVEDRRRSIISLASVLTYSRSIAGDQRHTSVCGNTLDAYGWEPNQLVTDPDFWRTSLHPEDAPRVAQALASLPEQGECSVEYRLRRPGGGYVWFLDKMALLKDAEGEPVEIVGFLLDISRTKELERELREALLAANAASQAKSDFLANMSHELTTPLNAVIGFSEVLLDRFFGELNGKQDEYVNIIRDSGLRLLAMLTDILQLAKLDAGDETLTLAPASPAALMRTTLEMNRERALRHGLTMDLELTPDMERETALDELKFRQVLFALLGNAVKFSPENGRVKISGRRIEKNGGEILEVSVEDSGPGIPAKFATDLFTPFTQLERPQTKTHQGVGLGLALARRLARLQGGEVDLADTSARGSRLVFTLPVPGAVPGGPDGNLESSPDIRPGTTPGA